MSSRGGLTNLTGELFKNSSIPVSTKIVKESLKSIILSGESDLDKFVSHRILYILGFFTGWNPKVFSLEFLPFLYFFIWSIVLFSLREYNFAYMFLIAGILVLLYFFFLHTVISSWDKIRHWFIKRARKRGGVGNLTLEDIKFLLIYTRKVFGVKVSIPSFSSIDFNADSLRKSLIKNKQWQNLLNIVIILELFLITCGGIYGFIIKIDILNWMLQHWYYILIFFLPITIILIGMVISKNKIKHIINGITVDELETVLTILNEFKIFGLKNKK